MSFARILFLVREDWNGKILRDKLTLTCTLLAILNFPSKGLLVLRPSRYAVPKTLSSCLKRCAYCRYAVAVHDIDTVCLLPWRLTGSWLCLLLLQTEFWPWSRFIGLSFFWKLARVWYTALVCIRVSKWRTIGKKNALEGKAICKQHGGWTKFLGGFYLRNFTSSISFPYGLYWRFDLRSG